MTAKQRRLRIFARRPRVRQVGPSVAGLTARCWRTITGVGTNNLIVAAALLLALSLGCAEDSSEEGPRHTATTTTDDELRRVPLPEVGGLDPEIQLQVRQAHRRLETSMDAGTSAHEEHGRLGMQLDAFGLRDAAEIAYRNARQSTQADKTLRACCVELKAPIESLPRFVAATLQEIDVAEPGESSDVIGA